MKDNVENSPVILAHQTGQPTTNCNIFYLLTELFYKVSRTTYVFGHFGQMHCQKKTNFAICFRYICIIPRLYLYGKHHLKLHVYMMLLSYGYIAISSDLRMTPMLQYALYSIISSFIFKALFMDMWMP